MQEAGTEPLNVSSGDGVWGPVAMHFVDTRGREWRRTQTSLKEGSMPDAVAKPLQAHNFVVGTDAKVREVESCGDAGGAVEGRNRVPLIRCAAGRSGRCLW